MDTTQWTQDIGLVTSMAAEIGPGPSSTVEKKVRPQKDCPRCHSTNTKFCYYNNYSLTQPRYFCKACRRYWTEGGTLRNVPVGGGLRKNKRSSSSSSSLLSSSSQKLPHLSHPTPNILSHHQSLQGNINLGFSAVTHDHNQLFHGHQFLESGRNGNNNQLSNYMSSSSSSPTTLDLNALYKSGFAFQELKRPGLSFSSTDHEVQENGAKLMFPFGAGLVMKQFSGTNIEAENHHQTKEQENLNAGYWNGNGMLGGGSW